MTGDTGAQARNIDASTFASASLSLAEAIAQKIKREAPKLKMTSPIAPYFFSDIYLMLRQSADILRLLCWINSEALGEIGFDRTSGYAVQSIQLIRALIDRLYNICALLDAPIKAQLFREDGYRRALKGLADDEARYAHILDSGWAEYILKRRELLSDGMRRDGITLGPKAKYWPLLGTFLKSPAGKTARGVFLRALTKGFWNEYSSLSHGTFAGLMDWAFYSMPDDAPHSERDNIRLSAESRIATHLPRGFALLACQLTEIQAFFHFNDADIDERLHGLWDALIVAPEVREIYEGRYRELMERAGIRARLNFSDLRKSLGMGAKDE